MTNREAIKMLKTILRTVYLGNRKFNESIQMAISALEKQEAIKSCTPPSDDWEHYADRLHDIAYQSGYEQGNKDAEQGGWIPCSVRLPLEKDAGILKKLGKNKRSDYVLATVEVKGERMTATACTYDGRWDWKMKYAFPDYKVIAWRPLPEHYTEEDNDKS